MTLPSPADIKMIRFAIADTNCATFGDEDLQLFWADAQTLYASGDVFIWREYTIVTALIALRADSAKLTTYRQNTQSDNLSDVHKHLQKEVAYHRAELAALERRGKSSTRFAVPKKVPTRLKEYPDS